MAKMMPKIAGMLNKALISNLVMDARSHVQQAVDSLEEAQRCVRSLGDDDPDKFYLEGILARRRAKLNDQLPDMDKLWKEAGGKAFREINEQE